MEQEKSLRYNEGKPQWSLVDFKSLEPLVRVMEYGKHKYSIYEDSEGKQHTGATIPISETYKYKLVSTGKENWKKGLDRTEILESLSRHLFALMSGEELDKESNLNHAAHILANSMFYIYHYGNRDVEINKEL